MGLFGKKKKRNIELLKTFDGREVKYVTRRLNGESVIVGKSGRIAVIGDDIRIICGEADVFNGNIDTTTYYLLLSGDGVTVEGENTVTGGYDNITVYYKYHRSVRNMFSVIFDMDGTLLDTQKIAIPAWDYSGQLQGYENLGRLIPEVCGMNEVGWSKVLLSHAPDIDVDLFNKTNREYYLKYREIKPMPGMFELLDFLKEKGVKMAVASGSKTSSIVRNLNIVNAMHYFDAVIGGEEVQNGKPAPDIFRLAAEKLGEKPCDCFVFEDSPNGVRSAYAAGMRCFGVPDVCTFSDDVKALLTYEIKSLSDAVEILNKYF